jgi:type I restriction enzyme S subunit
MKRNSGHPRGWRPAHLEDLVFFQRGFDITKAEQRQGNIPVVSSSGIQSYHSEAKVEGPGVVIGRKGSLGTVHFVDCPYWPHDTTLWSKDLRGNDPRYLYYFVHTMGFERYDVGNSNPTLNRNHIHGLDILIPPLRTQKAIVEVLSTYDDLIENNRRRIQLLEQAARLLYKEWFVHLRFPGHEHTPIIEGVPEGWEKTCYNELFEFHGGFAFKSKTYQAEGKYGIVTIKNVHDARFVPECSSRLDSVPDKMKPHCLLSTGDILLSLTGNVGRACIAYGENFLLNQRVAKIVGKDIPRSFVYWTFSSDASQRELENLAYGVAQLNLSPVKLGEQEFLRPSSMLLEMFAEICEPVFQQICTLNLSNQQLTKARDLLLPKLMNGEVAV